MTTLPTTFPAAPVARDIERAAQRKRRLIVAGAVLGVIVFLGIVGYLIYLMATHPTKTETVRDIFIIFAALVLVLIMLTLAILIIQVARLINVLQHEIKPILASTNETVNTVRGTAEFLGDNLVQPVVKLSGYVAAVQRVAELLRPGNLFRK